MYILHNLFAAVKSSAPLESRTNCRYNLQLYIMSSPQNFVIALEDFRAARRRAALEVAMAALTGRPTTLLPYDEVRQKLHARESARRELRNIPVAAIVGSVDRYTDFTRSFLPRLDSTGQRWARVSAAAAEPTGGLPPIEVYQVGDAYFVIDGNHRVSIARQLGSPTIQAYVTEVHTRVPFGPNDSVEDLIIKARHVEFLERTHLDEYFPDTDFTITAAGNYRTLENDIEAYRFIIESQVGAAISDEAAVRRWYEERYQPIVNLLCERGLLVEFPDRTETDLYVWLIRHQLDLQAELDWDIPPDIAAAHLADEHGQRGAAQPVPSLATRLRDLLTAERPLPTSPDWQPQPPARRTEQWAVRLLVPINGEPESWAALDQALVVATRSDTRIYGLHVLPTLDECETDWAKEIKTEFEARLAAANVGGRLALEVGAIERTIVDRARWADIVILRIQHPPGTGTLNRLTSDLRNLIRRCPRPILAVPGAPSPLTRAFLAYDSSPKAREALYIAAYLAAADGWRLPLVVAAANQNGATTAAAWLDDARIYLDSLSLPATYLELAAPTDDPATALIQAATDHACDLILIGGYSRSFMLDVVLGNTVDRVLRTSPIPVLICH